MNRAEWLSFPVERSDEHRAMAEMLGEIEARGYSSFTASMSSTWIVFRSSNAGRERSRSIGR
jgi:hypothetical protein